jgi:hypothetical protein
MVKSLGRFPGTVWRHKWAVLAALLIGMLVGAVDAYAQKQVLRHDFKHHTIYIVLVHLDRQATLLEVWRRQDGGCAMYPSVVEMTKAGVQFKSGRAWRLQAVEDGIEIGFPDGTSVTYKRAKTDPQQLCIGSQGT